VLILHILHQKQKMRGTLVIHLMMHAGTEAKYEKPQPK
jgi:hypothetical protein